MRMLTANQFYRIERLFEKLREAMSNAALSDDVQERRRRARERLSLMLHVIERRQRVTTHELIGFTCGLLNSHGHGEEGGITDQLTRIAEQEIPNVPVRPALLKEE